MIKSVRLLAVLGGEAGCKRLAEGLYARIRTDPVLRPLFPGKSLKCAVEEFSAFLIQFLGGDEEQTQRRWWLSLRESHDRFRIGPDERSAWLKQMGATLEETPLDDETRKALLQFFEHSSAYIAATETGSLEHDELASRWGEQRCLDDAIAAIAQERDNQATALAQRFISRPAVFVGLLARMIQSGRAQLLSFVVDSVERDASLTTTPWGGRTLLHYASSAGCLEIVRSLLRIGGNPDIQDSGGHTPLYSVANECPSEAGPEIVRALVEAGADVNACGGAMRTTPLHMAARRGYVGIARALLHCGAAIEARDKKECTALQRAINCRRAMVVQLLIEQGAGHGNKA